MSDVMLTPCPDGLNEINWTNMLLDLDRVCAGRMSSLTMLSCQAEHVLVALRFYAEHGGEIPDPPVKPWRNRHMTPEGVSQKEWDTTIRDMERFARNVASHQMTILKDDGPYRHVRFMSPLRFSYWFELVTWPGVLTIHGDCGTYSFSRENDMFGFFRESRINPYYWTQKCVSEDRSVGIKEFSEEEFRIKTLWCMAGHLGLDGPSEVPEEIVDKIEDEVVSWCCDGKDTAIRKAWEWEFEGKRPLSDIHEYAFDDLTHGFLWCLHAIRWGVEQWYRSREFAMSRPTPSLIVSGDTP